MVIMQHPVENRINFVASSTPRGYWYLPKIRVFMVSPRNIIEDEIEVVGWYFPYCS